MWGKHFESMYDGSMYGAGLSVFAVWGYVIAHARGGWIELNPIKLSHTLGGSEEEVCKAIEFLSSPDPRSRCKDYEGRRLVKEGEFKYVLPTWEIYHKIRKEEDRREQNRVAQAKFRETMKSSVPEVIDPAVRIRAKRKPSAPKEVIYAALEGYKGNTHDLADKLKELHGVEDGEFEPGGPADPELAAETKAKIARAEELEEEVKIKLEY